MSMVTPKTMLIVVDTHSQEFVESAELLTAVSRVVVIDHHRMMVKHIENALVFYHEPYASSTSEMVAELVQYIGDGALNQTEAEALLSGIMLDTKNFVLKTGVRTFEAAAYLRRRGADTVEVKRMKKLSGKKYTIQRSKGLGENEPDMMNLTTMNPATRRLIKVMPSEAIRTGEVFDLLLGDNLSGRKDFIAQNGYSYIDSADVS